MDAKTKKRIEEMIKKNKVFIFMKGTPEFPQCGFSARAAHVLQELCIDFGHFNVLEDFDIWEGIKEYGNWPTIPQIYIDGKLIGGCDITVEMYETGELQKLVGK